MRFTLTIVHAGFLTLSVAALAPPSLAQTGAPAGSGWDPNPATGDYPGYLAPGAVVPPYLAPGLVAPLPNDTTGSGIRHREYGPSGMDTPTEAPIPSRKGLIDDE
jgi:hypothetical protein